MLQLLPWLLLKVPRLQGVVSQAQGPPKAASHFPVEAPNQGKLQALLDLPVWQAHLPGEAQKMAQKSKPELSSMRRLYGMGKEQLLRPYPT